MKFIILFSIVIVLLLIVIYLLGKGLGIEWIKQTLSSGDGTSAKRSTMFFYVVVFLFGLHASYMYLVLHTSANSVVEVVVLLREIRQLIYPDEIFVLVIAGIFTAQDILTGARFIKEGRTDGK